MQEIVNKYFDKSGSVFCKNLSVILPPILQSSSANTAAIKMEMIHFTAPFLISKFNKKNKK